MRLIHFFLLVGLAVPAFATNGTVRVLSYNILQGGRNTDNSRNLQRVADVIRLFDPDVVGLQEVDRNTARCGKRDIPAELARLTGLSNMAYGAAMPYQGGHYGNAVLSRHPLQVVTNVALPVGAKSEPRAALVVTVEAPAPFSMINAHLSVESAADREAQAAKLIAVVRALTNGPVVITGDFNCPPDSVAIGLLTASFGDASRESRPDLTFDSGLPDRQIDYILFAPADAWSVATTKTGAEWVGDDAEKRALLSKASDHLPLFSELIGRGQFLQRAYPVVARP